MKDGCCACDRVLNPALTRWTCNEGVYMPVAAHVILMHTETLTPTGFGTHYKEKTLSELTVSGQILYMTHHTAQCITCVPCDTIFCAQETLWGTPRSFTVLWKPSPTSAPWEGAVETIGFLGLPWRWWRLREGLPALDPLVPCRCDYVLL